MSKLVIRCHDCKKLDDVLIKATVRVVKDKDTGHRVTHETYFNCEECFSRSLKNIRDLYKK